MPKAAALVLVGMLLVGACGGSHDKAPDTRAPSPTNGATDSIVIRTSVTVAATEGAEPIATGTVQEGSTLEGAPLCVGGTILDSHASRDPAIKPYGLIAMTITCPDGVMKVGFSPSQAQGGVQTGSWTLVSGTGAFAGLHASGKLEVKNDPDPNVPVHETFTGTVER
ncbi:MAG: hypothetical protein QOK42_2068 [Frankiaceae bacterium]|nr:hypothetical protein [Frankiaceae bacterium]